MVAKQHTKLPNYYQLRTCCTEPIISGDSGPYASRMQHASEKQKCCREWRACRLPGILSRYPLFQCHKQITSRRLKQKCMIFQSLQMRRIPRRNVNNNGGKNPRLEWKKSNRPCHPLLSRSKRKSLVPSKSLI